MLTDAQIGHNRPGYLYRYWSDRGNLLYIGISVNAVARLGQHKDKEWFLRIAKITIERFDTYDEAQVAELRAICYEGPIHNIVGPRDAKDLGPALTRLRASKKRQAAKMQPRHSLAWDQFQADLAFGTIPADTSFHEYQMKKPRAKMDAERA